MTRSRGPAMQIAQLPEPNINRAWERRGWQRAAFRGHRRAGAQLCSVCSEISR